MKKCDLKGVVGLNNERLILFIKLLMNRAEFMTSKEICNHLSISGRTLRDDLSKFKDTLIKNGIQIISKRGTGYRLKIIDEDKYYSFIHTLLKEEENSQSILPVYPEDRLNYLLRRFLSQEDYLKLDDIAEEILISRSTLNNDMKEVRERLKFFNLYFVSKPGYGTKVEGNEMNKRSCILQYFFHTENLGTTLMKQRHMNENQEKVRDLLFETLNEKDFRLTDIGFQNLVIHISIALLRRNEHSNEEYVMYQNLKRKKEFEIATYLVKKINKAFQIELKEIEIYYITIHLLGKKAMQSNREATITEEVEMILQLIFLEIKNDYAYDFSADFELYTVLALHVQPMLNRLKYGLVIQNPLLEEIKKENFAAFELAITSAKVIKKELNYDLSEAEMGYLALHFALAMERSQKKEKKKKNIIIVCASGAGSSQILLYKVQQRFKESLDKILVTEMYKLNSIDQKEYDFILSTVPIQIPTEVPVIEVQYFLNDKDVINISNEILQEMKEMDFVDKYFNDQLFFKNIEGNSKEEVIQNMIEKIRGYKKIPPNFKKLVLEREAFATTEYGNMIAIPHPMSPVSDETFVSVGILKKAIHWENKKVRYIFLTSVKKNSQEDLHLFYETISALVLDTAVMQEFEKEMTIKNLKLILRSIAEEQKKHRDNFFI